MLAVEPVDSLKHIRTRKMLDPLTIEKEKDTSSSGLGSDGETSDYQRSTPSPQDSNTRITELTEGRRSIRLFILSYKNDGRVPQKKIVI